MHIHFVVVSTMYVALSYHSFLHFCFTGTLLRHLHLFCLSFCLGLQTYFSPCLHYIIYIVMMYCWVCSQLSMQLCTFFCFALLFAASLYTFTTLYLYYFRLYPALHHVTLYPLLLFYHWVIVLVMRVIFCCTSGATACIIVAVILPPFAGYCCYHYFDIYLHVDIYYRAIFGSSSCSSSGGTIHY